MTNLSQKDAAIVKNQILAMEMSMLMQMNDSNSVAFTAIMDALIPLKAQATQLSANAPTTQSLGQ